MNAITRPELFDFHGVQMTHFYTENWVDIQNFKARPDDILIATYPKAGTHWLAYILDLLYFGQKFPEREVSIPNCNRAINVEFSMPAKEPGLFIIKATELLDNFPTSPRIIKTHLPVQFLPKSFWEQNCKIIYVGRNAKDTVVSYFHFEQMLKLHPEPGNWSSYLQRFMEGKMVFGSWYDHVTGWWEKKQSYPNIHYMFYEDLIEDTGREMDKICEILGLSLSAEEKETIMGKVKFDAMKMNKMTNNTKLGIYDYKKSSFIRKGKVGDWKNHFTVAQNEEFDEDYKNKMTNPKLQFFSNV